MIKWKILVLLVFVVIQFTFAACSSNSGEDTEGADSLADTVKAVWDENYDYGTLSVGGEEDVLSNAFFDWKVNSIDTETSLHGSTAGDGKVFLIINISVTNTEDYEYETGNYEFLCITGPEESDEVETMNSFYDEMIPDTVDLAAGDTLTGDLVFEISEDVKEVLLDYEEFWSDGSTGNTNWFDLSL